MGAEVDFNSIQFEKKLTGLKDSQDSINACCLWCLENRQHHKKIVSTWLNVLKRVRVEQRLTLFYLANDVIQYSKRKNYEFVESWGTALQKATTMVRDEKVKHKILRIFKIWEQRAVYGEEFITDLSGLISASPTTKKIDETHEFQSSYLINKIRNCAKLETETDHKLRMFKQHNPKLLDGEALVSSLKDRAHVDDVEKEMEDYVTHMEDYINALKMEIKSRNNLINLLLNAETQLEKDRKDVKEVALAYKLFATRVKNLKKKLDEKKLTLSSPIPSPDINAPSPSPDSDLDLPETNENTQETESFSFSNAGFYNPVSTCVTDTTNSFVNNGFSSFIGSGMNFNMQNINTSTLFNDTRPISSTVNQTQNTDSSYTPSNIANLFPSIIQPPPPPEPVPPVVAGNNFYNQQQMPLAPPPLPPFTKTDPYNSDGMYNDYNNDQNSYEDSYNSQQVPPVDPYQPYTPYENNSYTSNVTNYESAPPVVNNDTSYSYDPYNPDDYNPEEEPETWDVEEQWDQPPRELDTPASPPPIEKEGFLDPIEYHDGEVGEGVDVDHRILEMLTKKSDKKKDVDHRNLISLTGSPRSSSNTNDSWPHNRSDQDYRNVQKVDVPLEDQDYRMQYNTAPPPIPPILQKPPKSNNNNIPLQQQQQQSPKKEQDNTESIDMELSDDEELANNKSVPNKIVEENGGGILPPPPFPDDANNFLDSLNDSEYYDDQPSFDVYENLDLSAAKDDSSVWNNTDDFVEEYEHPPPQPFMEEPWNMEPQQPFHHHPPHQQHHRPYDFRGRGRGNRGGGFFRGRGGEFNRGDFRGRARGGRGKFGRGGGWGETPPKRGGMWFGRPRGPRGFSPRGNFRNNY